MAASAARVLHPSDFAQGFGKAGQALYGFQRVDTSNLELESDGFEETQVRLRFVVPHPCVSKTRRRMDGAASVCAGSWGTWANPPRRSTASSAPEALRS